MNSVERDNSLIKLKDIIDIYPDCNNDVDSVNLINGVCDLVLSNSSLSADGAGTCDEHCSKLVDNSNVISTGTCDEHCSKLFDNSNVISTGNCVRPTVVGDTNSWTRSIFPNFNHESWCDNYGTQISMQDSTIFLADRSGELVGTCIRMYPNMGYCHGQIAQCIQVVFSVYEISNIFNFKCGHIVHIAESMEANVNGFYHIYWNAYVIQRRMSEWGGFMRLIDAFSVIVRCTQLLDNEIDPKLHYDNYCRDMQCFQYYGCSYTTYITHIIDSLCHHEVSHYSKYVANDCGHSKVHCPEFSRQLSSSSPSQPNAFYSLNDKSLIHMANRPDFNFPDKARAHLVHAETSF